MYVNASLKVFCSKVWMTSLNYLAHPVSLRDALNACHRTYTKIIRYSAFGNVHQVGKSQTPPPTLFHNFCNIYMKCFMVFYVFDDHLSSDIFFCFFVCKMVIRTCVRWLNIVLFKDEFEGRFVSFTSAPYVQLSTYVKFMKIDCFFLNTVKNTFNILN